MQSIQRYVHNALATLLQIDPAQRISILLIILCFLVALNLCSSVIYTALMNQPLGNLLMVVSPLLTIVVAVYWLAQLARRTPTPQEPQLAQPPAHTGMIWMLSIFGASVTLPNGSSRRFAIDDLRAAFATPTPDLALIEQMVEAPHSNLRPLLSAIRHHRAHTQLKHLWLIATDDLPNPFGNESVQRGSKHLRPLVKRLLSEVYPHVDLTIHDDDPQLIVHPHQVNDTYRAVQYIMQRDAPRLGLTPGEIIADITGGRVPMSCGMILACAPNDWHLQFTSTDFDPATNTRPERPIPMQISVDLSTVLRQTLDATGRRLNTQL